MLARQRARGVLGPDDLGALRAHSRGFAAARAEEQPPRSMVDLGSGGGVPGLVLAAEEWTSTTITLVDASQRRCTFLELCIVDLVLAPRVSVLWGRAEEVGRDREQRGAHDLVVARSFGPPAVLAECAAPLLEVDGRLVVSEPPGAGGDRWDAEGLHRLGMVVEATVIVEGASYTRLRQVEACPTTYPRRPGVPTKRPLF